MSRDEALEEVLKAWYNLEEGPTNHRHKARKTFESLIRRYLDLSLGRLSRDEFISALRPRYLAYKAAQIAQYTALPPGA